MLKAMKQKWVEALRSGEYQQCRGELYMHGSFCAIGVLCAVMLAHNNLPVTLTGMLITQESVIQWAGNNGEVEVFRNIAWLNDHMRLSFPEIATWIEEHMPDEQTPAGPAPISTEALAEYLVPKTYGPFNNYEQSQKMLEEMVLNETLKNMGMYQAKYAAAPNSSVQKMVDQLEAFEYTPLGGWQVLQGEPSIHLEQGIPITNNTPQAFLKKLLGRFSP